MSALGGLLRRAAAALSRLAPDSWRGGAKVVNLDEYRQRAKERRRHG